MVIVGLSDDFKVFAVQSGFGHSVELAWSIRPHEGMRGEIQFGRWALSWFTQNSYERWLMNQKIIQLPKA